MTDPDGTNLDALAALLARPDVAAVLAVLDCDGEETRIVGGAVRNTLLGRPVSDLDLATTARPEVTLARARAAGFKAVPTGLAHGTVTVIADGRPFEVTTLREDVATDGRHAIVRFGRSFAQDAARRDFTINALSLGRDGQVHDTTDGLADLTAGRVRFIGAARARIREDYLRVLRFFRFHAEYAAGPPDPDGLAAAIAERDGLAILSGERIRAELLKLLVARGAGPAVAILGETGLLARLLGGVADLGRFARATGVATHEGATPPALLRFAALAVATREDATRLRDRLRLSNDAHARLVTHADLLARLHGRADLDRAETCRLAFGFGARAVAETLAILDGEPRPHLEPEARALVQAYAAGTTDAPVFGLSGRDLVARGTPPGPELGQRLALIRTAWLEAGCPDGLGAAELIALAG